VSEQTSEPQGAGKFGATPRVEVFVSPELYGNLDTLQAIQRSIFDKLGCGGCYSGYDVRIDLARQFLVTPNMEITEISDRQFR
jgi:hypothetical protein